MQQELNEILSKHTGQSVEKILADSDRDRWMKAQVAKEYGMVDEVIIN